VAESKILCVSERLNNFWHRHRGGDRHAFAELPHSEIVSFGVAVTAEH